MAKILLLYIYSDLCTKKNIMLKKSITLLFLAILCINCKTQKPLELNTNDYADVINKEFTGNLAFKTTSFVEKY